MNIDVNEMKKVNEEIDGELQAQIIELTEEHQREKDKENLIKAHIRRALPHDTDEVAVDRMYDSIIDQKLTYGIIEELFELWQDSRVDLEALTALAKAHEEIISKLRAKLEQAEAQTSDVAAMNQIEQTELDSLGAECCHLEHKLHESQQENQQLKAEHEKLKSKMSNLIKRA